MGAAVDAQQQMSRSAKRNGPFERLHRRECTAQPPRQSGLRIVGIGCGFRTPVLIRVLLPTNTTCILSGWCTRTRSDASSRCSCARTRPICSHAAAFCRRSSDASHAEARSSACSLDDPRVRCDPRGRPMRRCVSSGVRYVAWCIAGGMLCHTATVCRDPGKGRGQGAFLRVSSPCRTSRASRSASDRASSFARCCTYQPRQMH